MICYANIFRLVGLPELACVEGESNKNGKTLTFETTEKLKGIL